MTLPGNQREHRLSYSAVPAGVWLACEASMTFGQASSVHTHQVTQFLVMLTGRMRLHAVGLPEPAELGPGDIVAIPPDVVHSVERGRDRRVRLLDLRLDLDRFIPLEQSLRLGSGQVVMSRVETKDVEQIRHRLVEAAESHDPHRTVQTIALVWEVARLLMRDADAPNPRRASDANEPTTDARLAVVDSYIREKLNEPIGLPDLARVVRLSPSQLTRQFKARFNTTPGRYLEARRIEQAVDLLAAGTYAVKEIATLCGFQGVPQFHRSFKRVLGRTPRQVMRDTARLEDD